MHASAPKFSVIIPNYNNAGTLARALDSALSQTWPAHEIIVVDDGSVDDSRAVAASYGDRIVYLYQPNAGVSAARNAGVRHASGDWLAFLDADDTFAPERLAAHADWIRRDPDLDFLLSDQDFRAPDGSFLHRSIDATPFGRALLERHRGQVEIVLGEDDFGPLIGYGFVEIRTLSLPRHTFERLGGFPLGKKIGEDVHLMVRLCAASRRVGVVTQSLADYYLYPANAIRKDVAGAQRASVSLFEELLGELAGASPGVRAGMREKLRQARLNMAYMHLRQGRRRAAVDSVLPLLRPLPRWGSLCDVLSIVRGIR
ncbi:glycosyltransferase family A protein [uncultured Massilia sp.]|uniref:glycosyltransferase family 2 protein n=1 Tax=uncultured Massilia sp. TaxID=169973 RepID=UPI00258581E7|nr:glycosyltransferase family A protein [uncultured Massilia sp.]